MRYWTSKERARRAKRPGRRVDTRGPMRHSQGMRPRRDANRLADFVLGKRAELKISQIELARRMGTDVRTVRRIEAGQSVSKRTMAAIDVALELPHGSARAAAEGGELPEATPPAPEFPADLQDDVERQLWSIEGLTEEERWQYIDLHRLRARRS
jgi:transcriptional regulator with XRE-family HTH domain